MMMKDGPRLVFKRACAETAGGAAAFELIPAYGRRCGGIRAILADVGDDGPVDWDGATSAILSFTDVGEILNVLEGNAASVTGGAVEHWSKTVRVRIAFDWLEPDADGEGAGYRLSVAVWAASDGHLHGDRSFTFTEPEAAALRAAFSGCARAIAFGA